eukprot:6210718-Pleurochrysis_carterae.AAC.2
MGGVAILAAGRSRSAAARSSDGGGARGGSIAEGRGSAAPAAVDSRSRALRMLGGGRGGGTRDGPRPTQSSGVAGRAAKSARPDEMDARTRRATAETIAARVEEMGLGGALGSEALDRWGLAGLSAEAAANATRLRKAARARVVE